MRNRIVAIVSTLLLASAAGAAHAADPIDAHPNAAQLKAIFAAPPPADFRPTGVTRADYLKLIAANVDFFKRHQSAAGAIIDPVSKGERQYSTPAFAAAAGVLVKEAGRADLLDPASRALTRALNDLVDKKAADSHPDFYIPMLVHAHRSLKEAAPPEQAKAWRELFAKIDPRKAYRADLRHMNWNIVSNGGELLRRHDGLVADDKRADQMAYLEECLAGHLKHLKPLGLFEDPGVPMIYDAFSRLWLEDALADAAYDGRHADRYRAFLRTGGLSSLLLLSPTGEWPNGGRSGLHNWGEAQMAAICEINAAHWKKAGRDDVAGAFKRAAHLSFQSVARWQRPSGELWIIRNRAEPETRFAYEPYSNHSQYNLLPMAMLAIAHARADESIAERPTPAEVGGYVFDARETFHKVAAAAGGYYVLIDAAADPKYNATGLQRVHRAGVPFPALSDSSAAERAYGDKDGPKAAVAPGVVWLNGGDWLGLADFAGGKAKRSVKSADLGVATDTPDKVAFDVAYDLAGDGARRVTERYVLTPDGVGLTSTVAGEGPFVAILPVLVHDGAADTDVKLTPNVATVTWLGSTTTIELPADAVTDPMELFTPRLVTHNGHVQKASAGLRSGTATFKVRLSQASPAAEPQGSRR